MDLSRKHLGFSHDKQEGRSTDRHHNSSSTSPAENGCDSAWDRVPEELVARILSLLPFSGIYLARGVCRKWRSIIWSPLFMSLCKLQSLRMPWLLEFQQHMYNQVWAYDLAGCQWFHLDFFFLPENAIVVAASGGLVCLGRVTEEGYTLFVCNPLTKGWKKLPSIPLQPSLVLVDVDQRSNLYKVIALVLRGQAGDDSVRSVGSVFVFDAKCGVWRETLGIPRELHTQSLWDATISEGVLYCLTMEREIEAYDLDQGAWSPIAIAQALLPHRYNRILLRRGHQPSAHDYILDRQGQLIMVTKYDGLRAIFVNGQNINARSWGTDCSEAATGSVICAGRFSSLWLTLPHGENNVYLMHSGGNKRYCSGSRSYHELPRSPLTRHKMQGDEIVVKGLWFEPRLDATTQVG